MIGAESAAIPSLSFGDAMIVLSVHVPKAAGTTLKHIFQFNFGERLKLDYNDDPLNPVPSAPNEREDPLATESGLGEQHDRLERVIHGHFHIERYRRVKHAYRVTFLRHPVDALISLYCFWKSIAKHNNPIHDWFIDHDVSIMELAQVPQIANLLSETYFGGVDMASFDFIGCYEHRQRDLAKLAKRLNMNPLLNLWQNRTVDTIGEGRTEIRNNRDLVAALSDSLKADINFYERYCKP